MKAPCDEDPMFHPPAPAAPAPRFCPNGRECFRQHLLDDADATIAEMAAPAPDAWTEQHDAEQDALTETIKDAAEKHLGQRPGRVSAPERRAYRYGLAARDAAPAPDASQCENVANGFPACPLIAAQAREIAALHERLEDSAVTDMKGNRIAVAPGSIPDGIECRDQTIRGQDELIDQLRRDLAAARADAERMRDLLDEARPATGYEEETEAHKDLVRRIDAALAATQEKS
jgi:hypothetical protein